MSTITPRRSTRTPHNHTPKMSERKKGLFQAAGQVSRESLTQHRRLPVVDSESDGDDCDLGIISTLDSSSCDEQQDQNGAKTPERNSMHGTRSHSKRLLKESQDLKNFIKSPFTLNKYQTRYCPDSKCSPLSTPATPRLQYHPGTPSSTHSCASIHTPSSTSSRARKSLASLIADTESCSSSLKDLNFDSDSATDSKENTPTKLGKHLRKGKSTPSFKGILKDQKKNVTSSPIPIPLVCLTKMDFSTILSPTQMLKTPNSISETASSPPKIGHNRRPVLEIAESPENSESEKSHKRPRNDSLTETEPNSKYPKLDTSGSAPKAHRSLFTTDRLKEMLSTKSFYGKKSPELNTTVTSKLSNAIVATTHSQHRRSLSSGRRSRKPGQINLGVRHRIRKPKQRGIVNVNRSGGKLNESVLNSTANMSMNKSSVSQDTSQEIDNEKVDRFDKEKQTIEALLSQWTEDEVPESELRRPELQCFNKQVIEDTNAIFQPITAVPVQIRTSQVPRSGVIVELGATTCADVVMSGESGHVITHAAGETRPLSDGDGMSDVSGHVITHAAGETRPLSDGDGMSDESGHVVTHGDCQEGLLPVDGGYLVVEQGNTVQEVLPDLDEIERELRMLDEQILKMARNNNMDADSVLASTDSAPVSSVMPPTAAPAVAKEENKLFPIFSNPNPGHPTTVKAATDSARRPILKSVSDQYVIDAGQKRFGATQCKECGVIYEIGDPQDEHDHLVYHNAQDVLKFNGWRNGHIVGMWTGGHVVRIRGGEAGWRRVTTLLQRVVHPQLGYQGDLPGGHDYQYSAYLYIEKKHIVGCLIAEPKSQAHKLIPGDPDCCSMEAYPVKCGISRIWTSPRARRRGLATRMLDCARASFYPATALARSELAFSAPTQHGKQLATDYCGTGSFYVYLE